MNTKKPRILILSSAEDINESIPLNDHFVAELKKRIGNEVSIEWHNYHNIKIEYKSDELQVSLLRENKSLKDFDFVYIKSFFRYSEIAGIIAEYLYVNNVRFVSSELKDHIAATKLTQLARLAMNKLPIPQTIFMLPEQFSKRYQEVSDALGVPFIFKSIDGAGGEENYLIKSEEKLQAALKEFPEHKFIAQKFIENDSDYRLLVVDGKVQLIIKRQRAGGDTHLNNTSQGAQATLTAIDKFPHECIDMSLQAAKIMKREIAGVDLLFETGTNNPYILEVNASPQIASGAFQAEKIDIYSKYFKNMVK